MMLIMNVSCGVGHNDEDDDDNMVHTKVNIPITRYLTPGIIN